MKVFIFGATGGIGYAIYAVQQAHILMHDMPQLCRSTGFCEERPHCVRSDEEREQREET